jgi:hypothetical protein
MAMLKPRRASSIAMPRPIPREAPVTRATCGFMAMANIDSSERTEFEARVAPLAFAYPPGPFESRIPVRFRPKDGFYAPFGVRFEFVCIKNQFVLSTSKVLSPLFAIDG